MPLDKSHHYIYRVGSDNQYRLHWTGAAWRYDFVAGGVPFDEQSYSTDEELLEGLSMHGLSPDQFSIDSAKDGEAYSAAIKKRATTLMDLGIAPCPKHGMTAKNPDGTCEACANTDYPDDFKGQEG